MHWASCDRSCVPHGGKGPEPPQQLPGPPGPSWWCWRHKSVPRSLSGLDEGQGHPSRCPNRLQRPVPLGWSRAINTGRRTRPTWILPLRENLHAMGHTASRPRLSNFLRVGAWFASSVGIRKARWNTAKSANACGFSPHEQKRHHPPAWSRAPVCCHLRGTALGVELPHPCRAGTVCACLPARTAPL